MTHHQILTDLKNKKFAPVYFLTGSEPFFVDQICDFFENHLLSEGEKSFNFTLRHGRDTIKRTGKQGGTYTEALDFQTIYNDLTRLPMMSPYQLVILKEAQEFKDLQKLSGYIEKPSPTTIFVICWKHKRFNANSKFGKIVKAKTVYFSGKKLWDNEVPDWISSELRTRKLRINPRAANLMAEYLGTDLSKISNELEKLKINLPEGTEVTGKHVEEFIGISREYNIFELQKAIGKRDVIKTNRIINYFISNPKKNPLVLIIGTLFNYFSKIYMFHYLKNANEKEVMSKLNLRSSYILKEYRSTVKHYSFPKTMEVLNILKEYDLKSKGVGFNNVAKPEGELLKEMTWRILH